MVMPAAIKDKSACGVTDVVTCAAQLLQISEYSLFQVAYKYWFGKPLDEKRANSFYSDYLLREIIPFWVSHMARTTVSRAADGELDPGEFGIEPPRQLDEDEKALGAFYITLMGLFLWFFVAMIIYTFPEG